MRTFFCALVLAAAIIGCDRRDIMDRPIIAEDFKGFMLEIDKVCEKTDAETCGNIKKPIILSLPEATNPGYRPSGDEIFAADEIFRRLNGKTPSELILIYKGILFSNLEAALKRDLDIKKNLDDLSASYEKTKKYAKDIIVSDIRLIPEQNANKMRLGFTVANRTVFTLRQLVAEVEFYSPSDILLGRTKSSVFTLTPNLKPGDAAIIKMPIDSIPENDLILIRAAKKLKIKVTVSSIRTDSKNESERNIILSLPYSYYRMRELLAESELLYNETVEKINAINVKKGAE